MAKKKKHKRLSGDGQGRSTRKSSEPTAFELAFRQAEESKKEARNEQQKPAPEVRTTKTKHVSSVDTSESAVGQPPRESVAPIDRGRSEPHDKQRVYNPPQPQEHKKPSPEPPVSNQPPRPKVAPTSSSPVTAQKPKKAPPAPVSLGLKPTDSNPVALKINMNSPVQSSKTAPGYSRHENRTGNDQVHQGNPSKESDIVIGFDFGTSSSKLIIRDSGLQTAYAVPFGALACDGNTYLLPTRVCINNDGTLDLSSGEHEYNELKIFLMDNPERVVFEATSGANSVSALDLATAYVALVVRLARQWFLQKTESIYRDTHIHWSINLGIPSKDYDNQSAKDSFRIVAMAAWRASRGDGDISILSIAEYRKEAGELMNGKKFPSGPPEKNSPWLHPDFVNVHPEVVMEVVGYARSPMRTNGLHMIVDVGATTMDAASFIIHNTEGEDVFPLLETSVERYGTMALHRSRMEAIKQRMESSLRKINCVDPNKKLPGFEHYEIAAINQDCINESDELFFQSCSKAIGEIIRVTKNRRDPYSDAWKKGLSVFVCGGGMRLASYWQMLERLSVMIAAGISDFAGLKLKEIPKPVQLDAPELSLNEYDRLAVAYGLSFTVDEIGEIIPQSKISNIRKRERSDYYDDRYVSKDMC